MTMNESILDAPVQFPAVTGIDMNVITRTAHQAALRLHLHGFYVGELCPDDGTRYVLMISRTERSDILSPRFLFGSSFGTVYGWNGNPTIHPDYALSHYVNDQCGEWTATVYALFLNAVAERLTKLV